jgi:hypothetical protein
MSSFIIVLFTKYCNNQIKKDELGGAYSDIRNEYTSVGQKNLKEIDWTIILK